MLPVLRSFEELATTVSEEGLLAKEPVDMTSKILTFKFKKKNHIHAKVFSKSCL